MGRNFWIILAVVVVAFAGVFFLMRSDSGNTSDSSSSEALSVQENDHKRGKEGADVTVIEYADFQCPACGVLYNITEQVYPQYADQIEFVFRHFPLTTIHQNAMAAHRAAEAAGNQDKFWEMYDMLYSRQSSWSSLSNVASVFESYAQELGLDVDQFSADYASEETSKVINASVTTGLDLGVNATPTFFVNGEMIDTPQSVEDFSNAIQSALDSLNSTDETSSNQ